MRALRNPYVIGVLVAAALALGYFRFRAPKHVAEAPPEAKPERPKIVGPEASMELDKLGWTLSPAREPFRATAPVTVDTVSDDKTEPAPDVLNLKAVWLQESGGWAVINGKVLGEGDTILDFRVEKILADAVLVQGPGGSRRVGFKPASSAAPRPAVLATASSPGKAPLKPTAGKPLTSRAGTKADGKLLPKTASLQPTVPRVAEEAPLAPINVSLR
jgi:hypothetical protein